MEIILLIIVIGQFWYFMNRIRRMEEKINGYYRDRREEFAKMEDTLLAILSEIEKVTEKFKAGQKPEKSETGRVQEIAAEAPDGKAADSISRLKKEHIKKYLRKGFTVKKIAQLLGIGTGEVELHINLANKDDGYGSR